MSHAATVVTIVDDDTENVTSVSTVRDIAERNGIKVTFAAIARNVERDAALATLLLDCQSAGHEIASHSYSHSPNVWSRRQRSKSQLAKMEQEIVRAHTVLTNLGFRVSSFAYPYGNFKGREYRSAILSMVAEHYPVAFNSRGGDNKPDGTHFQYVGRFPMRSHDSFTMVERFLRSTAREDNSWLVLMTHSGKNNFAAEELEAAIKICKSSGCVFATASEAAQMLRARGWRSISADATGENSLFDELYDFIKFHLPVVAIALLAFVLLIALIVGRLNRPGP
jgi:peptidoglycan/xylan/chitin deacetylase (PgdA/CDA1 family)